MLDRVIRALTVISAVGHEATDWNIDITEQCVKLADIAHVLIGQSLRKDITAVRINGNVQLSPLPARLHPMFVFQPLTGTVCLQARAVDDDVQGFANASIRINSLIPINRLPA